MFVFPVMAKPARGRAGLAGVTAGDRPDRSGQRARRLMAACIPALAAALVLAGCSSSPQGARSTTSPGSSSPDGSQGGTSSVTASGAGTGGAGASALACRATISSQLDEVASGGATFLASSKEPGRPIVASGGKFTASAVAKAVAGANIFVNGLSSICSIITTSYTARMLMIGAAFFSTNGQGGGPAGGSSGPQVTSPAQAEARMVQAVKHLTPTQRTLLINNIMNGEKTPGTVRETVTSVNVQVLTSAPGKVTMNVTTDFAEQGGTGNSSMQVTAYRFGDRWFATSFQ